MLHVLIKIISFFNNIFPSKFINRWWVRFYIW